MIEEFAGALLTSGSSAQGVDDGVLFVIAKQERKLRIHTGGGPGHAHRRAFQAIIADLVTPRFRTGDFAGGIGAGVDAIMKAIEGEELALPERARPAGRSTPFRLTRTSSGSRSSRCRSSAWRCGNGGPRRGRGLTSGSPAWPPVRLRQHRIRPRRRGARLHLHPRERHRHRPQRRPWRRLHSRRLWSGGGFGGGDWAAAQRRGRRLDGGGSSGSW